MRATGNQPTSSLSARCWSLLSSMYSTYHPSPVNNVTLTHWHEQACPWEETRHSGYFNGFHKAEDALEYASHRACSSGTDKPHLAKLFLFGHHIYIVGDSLMRQFAQSLMCRLRRWLQVVDDRVMWVHQNNAWGMCHVFPGRHLRHCQMYHGCVVFEGDVRICYIRVDDPFPLWISTNRFWKMVARHIRDNGGLSGGHTTVIGAHGMHGQSTNARWQQAAQLFPRAFTSSLNLSADAASPRRLFSGYSNITLVFKEMEASHFPTASGLYDGRANRSNWFCKSINDSDPLPPLRALELKVGLPIMKQLGWHMLSTFDDDYEGAANLHATHAKMPGRKINPIDCTHWMLPGVPDIWASKLLRFIAINQRRAAQAES